jgi:hypothetical protein
MKGFYQTRTKICSLCLREELYIRKIWNISIYSVCHIHCCLLIERCPQCDNGITPLSQSVHSCDFGYDYRKFEAKTVNQNYLSKFVNYRIKETNLVACETNLKNLSQDYCILGRMVEMELLLKK